MTALFDLTTSTPASPRTIVYIDGFNFYYGALKGTCYKWLDLARFFRLLRPHDNIQCIHYFKAMVDGPTRPNQETYLKALETTPLVEPVFGNFKRKRIRCTHSQCTYQGNRFFETREEKHTDVNIAVYMLDDAYQEACDQIVLVSGDSDLVPAVKIVRSRFPAMRIFAYVAAEHPTRGFAAELRSVSHKHNTIPLNLLKHAQFPDPVQDGRGGLLHKPASACGGAGPDASPAVRSTSGATADPW